MTRRQILDSSKLKEFTDDNFKFEENGRKLSKRVENTVGKGEIARYEQFLLFPQCFLHIQRTFCHFHQIWNCCLQTPLSFGKGLTYYQTKNFRLLQTERVCRRQFQI